MSAILCRFSSPDFDVHLICWVGIIVWSGLVIVSDLCTHTISRWLTIPSIPIACAWNFLTVGSLSATVFHLVVWSGFYVLIIMAGLALCPKHQCGIGGADILLACSLGCLCGCWGSSAVLKAMVIAQVVTVLQCLVSYVNRTMCLRDATRGRGVGAASSSTSSGYQREQLISVAHSPAMFIGALIAPM